MHFLEIIPIGFILMSVLFLLGAILYLYFSSTQHEYDPNDTRPLILLLREFQSDKSYYIDNFKYFPKEILTYELRLRIMYKLNKIGQFVCVGQPLPTEEENVANFNYGQNFLGESKFGARMIWFPDETWKMEVKALILKASLIIIRAGFTENILWEFKEIVNNCCLEKTVIYFEFGTKNMLAEKHLFEEFKTNKISSVLDLSSVTNYSQFIFFDNKNLPYSTSMLNETPIYKLLKPKNDSQKTDKYIVLVLIAIIIILLLFSHASSSN